MPYIVQESIAYNTVLKCILPGLGLSLSLYQTKILDWSIIQSICRQQNKFVSKNELRFGMGREHCGKS